jgi:DNA-binding transcriptional LysR family regulator
MMPLPQPYPEVASLDLLVSVSQLGSISAAARAHVLTQPAASMRVRTLEQTIGIQLLDRSKSGTTLTPAGAATVQWAEAVIHELRTLLTGTAALGADLDSHLHVAASLTVAEYLVPHWLQQLELRLPGVTVSLEMGNSTRVVETVTDGRAALGFIEAPDAPLHLTSQTIATDSLTVVVSPDHPWTRRRGALSPHELAATPLVVREPGSGTRDVLSEALAALGLGITVAIELRSTTAIKTAVIAGTGPAVVSAHTVGDELADGRLVAIATAGVQMDRSIRAVWPASVEPSRPARRLIEIATSHALAL